MKLITGGTGFLGGALIPRIKDDIRVVARNEGKLVELKEKYSNIDIIPGDIADPFICEMACKGVNGIYHLAAFKHVGLAEDNVRECVKSNIIGTLNILEQSRIIKPKFVIGISTDKAAQVTGVYGATKLLMEALFRDYEKINDATKYRIVRYGNVLYSTGSVLCKWRDLIKEGKELTVTDLDATRFYWTVNEAIDLIFSCLKSSKDSRPTSTRMKSIRIGTLLDAMWYKYGSGEPRYRVIGLQPGENKHEIISSDMPDSSQSEQYTAKEILNII